MYGAHQVIENSGLWQYCQTCAFKRDCVGVWPVHTKFEPENKRSPHQDLKHSADLHKSTQYLKKNIDSVRRFHTVTATQSRLSCVFLKQQVVLGTCLKRKVPVPKCSPRNAWETGKKTNGRVRSRNWYRVSVRKLCIILFARHTRRKKHHTFWHRRIPRL